MNSDPFWGSSEMAVRMRAFDWASTPLGPSATWPLSLRTVVRVLLTSRYAMWMGFGPDLTFFYNDAYGQMTLGAKHPWALGRPSREVWAEIWPQIGPRIDHVLETGNATWDEGLLLFLERNGYPEETYHTFSYSPVADDTGRIRGHLCVVTEETERVIGARRLAVLRDVAAGVASATNSQRELLAAASSTLERHGADLPFTLTYLINRETGRAELAGRSGIDAAHLAAPAVIDLADTTSTWPIGRGLSGGPFLISDLAQRLGELPCGPWPGPPASALLVPIAQQGHPDPAGVFVAALTPFRPVDDAYRSFVDLLVGQIAAGLANARSYEQERRRAEALAELDRAKTTFFSNVSHEFRTPLTLLLGPLEDAVASAAHQLAGPELDTAYRNALRLLKLVNALLDFARLEAGRIRATFEPTDLTAFTAELASVFRSAIERAGLTLTVECAPLPEPIYVDRDMWEKTVLNLISNAFKFTFAGGVTVRLAPEGDHVALTVRDTGIGIEPAELPRLFERFHRIEGARARTHEGSGIGLALVQELVRIHGGMIRAESVPAKGTAFTVTLPRGAAHLPADRVIMAAEPRAAAVRATSGFVEEALRWLPDHEAARARDDAGPASGVVLVVDDNADMREYITRVLGTATTVVTATNGEEALQVLRQTRVDLVLTDVMMPVLDGFGLLQAVRGEASLRDTPVVMLSARSGEEARIEGLEAGADDYLFKPFSARELIARVRSQLELSLARRQAAVERERLEEQAVALAQAQLRAESAARAKDEFLAMLGHELRNPLAPIFTALQLLRLRQAPFQELDVIERQVGHLTRLVDDLLDVSRITRGKLDLHPRPTEMSGIVVRAMEIVSPLLEQRAHVVKMEVPREGLLVNVDPDRMAQVISNLLTNAAKYSEAGSEILIRADEARGRVRCLVKDDGIGLPPEMLSSVFDAFVQQPQALDRSRGGLGLGLTIVRSLVEQHGGSVRALSAGPGRGSEFVVELPAITDDIMRRYVPGPSAALRVLRGARVKRVLVVDDNEDAAEMLKTALEMRGYEVSTAPDGPSALTVMERWPPDVALLDIGLPVMNGYELAGRLRAMPGGARVRLIAVTGYGQESDRDRSAAAGFDGHLVKPIDLSTIEQHLIVA